MAPSQFANQTESRRRAKNENSREQRCCWLQRLELTLPTRRQRASERRDGGREKGLRALAPVYCSSFLPSLLRGRLGGGVACNGGNNLGIVRLRPNPSLGLQEGREGGKEEGTREGKGGREGGRGRLYGPSRDVQGPDVELEARPRSKIAIDRSRHTFSEEVSRNLGSKFKGIPPSLPPSRLYGCVLRCRFRGYNLQPSAP